jgi:hypothetical protein
MQGFEESKDLFFSVENWLDESRSAYDDEYIDLHENDSILNVDTFDSNFKNLFQFALKLSGEKIFSEKKPGQRRSGKIRSVKKYKQTKKKGVKIESILPFHNKCFTILEHSNKFFFETDYKIFFLQ